MASVALDRCREFFGYHPFAKWTSILSSIVAGMLYVALIAIAGLFIDLCAERGEIQDYYQASPLERQQFFHEASLPDDPEERGRHVSDTVEELKKLGFAQSQIKSWASGTPIEKCPPQERELLWWIHVFRIVEERVDVEAGNKLRSDVKSSIQHRGLNHPIGNCGLLSLCVRGHVGPRGHLLGAAAGWNSWTWEYGNEIYLIGLMIGALAIAIARLGLLFLSSYFAAAAVLGAVTRLRRAIYHQTHRLGSLAFRSMKPGEAVNVSAHHLENIHEGMYLWLTAYFREPVKFGLLIAFAFLINFWLSMAFLLIAILVWLIGGQIGAHFRRQGRLASLRAAGQLSLVQESLALMRLIKVYLMEAFSLRRLERHLGSYARAQMTRHRGEAIYRPLYAFLGVLAATSLLYLAGYVILARQLDVANVLVLTTTFVSLYWPILRYVEARRTVRRTRESAVSLFEFLDRQGGTSQAIDAELISPMSQSIEFDNVSLHEPDSGRKILSNVSLVIHAGEKVALVGPDESQKHALVSMLPRLLDPTSGEVRIDGKNLRQVTLDSLRIQMAMVMQDDLIFSDTVANNIGCGDPAYNLQRIIDAAKVAHAHQFVTKLPLGYETILGEQGHSLNIGEKFRIALARAILREPALLIIEEPLTPLDTDTKGIIDDTLQRVTPGRTVIFLPHRLSTIRSCDQIFLLNDGAVAAAGDHRYLLSTSELYRHLQYLEFNEFAGTTVAQDSPMHPERESA